MNKTMKKVLSMLLVVLMCVTAVPFSGYDLGTVASAAETVSCANKDGFDLTKGYIYFGSYPQSKVKSSTITTALNNLAPEWDKWTSYGYYSGSGDVGTMEQGNWMRYTDVTYNGEKYRGVKFTEYRPYYTHSTSYFTNQDDNGYYTAKVYWFKFEPLKWRILDAKTGLIMCETIIDSQPYSNTIYSNGSDTYNYFNDASNTHYASDYETSSIRKWLNDDFYNTAFTSDDQNAIATTTLNNKGYYTLTDTTGYEKLDGKDTNDKIFLLSYGEVINSSYDFSSSSGDYDTKRKAKGSDYAKCQGLYISESNYNSGNYSAWLLRSPGIESNYCCCVNFKGNIYRNSTVDYTSDGVRPALTLDLDSLHTWTHTDAKDSTCTDDGNIEYWYCEDCKEYIVENKAGEKVITNDVSVPAKGHEYNYTASGNVITGTCNNCTSIVTATLIVDDSASLTYTGSDIEGLKVIYSDGWEGGKLDITYDNNTNAGTASGSITYDADIVATQTFNIAKALVTVTADDMSKTYGKDDPDFTYTVTGKPENGDELDITLTREEGEDVDDYEITMEQPAEANPNYDITFVKGTFTISQSGNEWIEEPSIDGWTYGDEANEPNKGTSKFGNEVKVEYKLTDADGTAYTEEVPTQAGKYIVRFSVEATDNYVGLSKEIELTIEKKTIGIEWGDTEFTYDGTYNCPTATATDVAFGDDLELTVEGAQKNADTGYTAIVTEITGDKADNYELPNDTQTTFDITQAELTVKAKDDSKTYGKADLPLTYSIIEGALADGDVLDINISREDGEDVNTYVITAGQDDGANANYDITFVQGEFTIEPKTIGIDWGDTEFTYDGNDKLPTATATDVAFGDDIELTVEGTQTDASTGYTATVTGITGDKADNYELPADVETTFDIAKAEITVTADDNSKIYSEDDPELTYTVTGKPENGDELDINVSRAEGEDVSDYVITASQADGANANYDITFVDGTFTISQSGNEWTEAPSIDGWTYGDVANDPTSEAKFGTVKVEYKLTDADDTAYTEEVPTEAGEYTVRFSVEATDNYTGLSKEIDIEIAKAKITVTADDKSKTYGENDPTLTYSVTSGALVGDDELDVVVTREDGEDVNDYVITVSQSEGANANYDITFETGTLTINKKTIGIVWGETDFLDDGTDKCPTATATGAAFDDELELVVEGAQIEIGTGYTATVTAITGDKADNYKLPEDVTTTFNIIRSCTCNCHKNAFAKFIYMILDVILTLFGSDYDCRCGESHF